jgi:hypothetical protein
MANPTTTTKKTDWLPVYKNWAAGRTGFTTDELVEIFAKLYNLTAQDLKTLKEQIAKEQPKPAAPKPAAPIPAPPQKQPEVKPTLIIARTPYPKWWKDLQTAAIDIDLAGTEIIILPNPNFYLYIATIVLTVSGETNITLHFGVFGESGAMDFGGEGEPRGIVIAMGNSPTSCGTGSFQITAGPDDVHVGGFVSYYRESVKET